MSLESLRTAVQPILDEIAELDITKPQKAKKRLEERFPLSQLQNIKALVLAGLQEGWLCPRGKGNLRYGRLAKPNASSHHISIDAVDMSATGPGHLHPAGEIDLCFSVEGEARFDNNPPGWTVYPPESWHIPTVTGGRMGILYFLPKGEIKFGPKE